MSELKPIIEQSMTQYAGAVLQSRALVDVRDCLKPSARQIFYCMDKYKYTANKPFQKTMAPIGDAMKHFYIHGDSSCEGIIMRAGQPFAMRYPLIEVKGNGGSLLSSGNWAAPRYTETRLSQLSANLFTDIDKDTISDWRDNYANNEQYPSVLPSKGFYNIVNGSTGIGIGMSCSLPQFNIKDVNGALVKLLWDADIADEELICMPDFATGGILLNEDEVRESLLKGHGKSCRLRSVVEYDDKENCLVVKEIPYGVYTNVICGQLEKLIEENIGIDRFNDLTGKTPLIKIYLSRRANPEQVLRRLYKDTSLQYYYGINFTMLEDGRFPRVFTWKEALQAYLTHQKEIYIRSFKYDLNKIEKRIHIIDGLFIALENIDSVVELIKKSSSASAAKDSLQKIYNLSEEQAKAILDIKLARLARLEVEKLVSEKEDLLKEASRIKEILENEDKLKTVIQGDLEATAKKYGDARRTRIMNLKMGDGEDEEPIEEKELILHLSNLGNIYIEEKSTLLVQRRGGKGAKVKLGKNEYLIDSIADSNKSACLAFSTKGKVYSLNMAVLTPGQKVNVREFFELAADEEITKILPFNKLSQYKYILFTTKNGIVKKSELEEYRIRKSKGVIALKLKDDDSIVGIDFVNEETLKFLTKQGKSVIIESKEINATGRATAGVCGIKLNPDDEVVCAAALPENTTHIVLISKSALTKKIPMSEFSIANRATKGSSIQKLKDGDEMASFVAVTSEDTDVTLVSNIGMIKIPLNSLEEHSKTTQGVHSKVLAEKEYIIKAVK
jgi:DNA gyrase subunit A